MDKAENPTFVVIPASWPEEAEAIAAIRRRVFIEEQGVPEALEWEARDGDCDWFVARSLSDLSDRSEPGGRARTVWHDFEAHSGTMQREIGPKWTALPTGAVDQSQVRQAPRVGDAVVGIARLTPDAQVGRMAVLPDWRGRGIGTALLRAVLQCAREKGLAVVTLHAQTHAVPFYARQGFRAEGAVFMEAGIPHRRMTLVIHEDE